MSPREHDQVVDVVEDICAALDSLLTLLRADLDGRRAHGDLEGTAAAARRGHLHVVR